MAAPSPSRRIRPSDFFRSSHPPALQSSSQSIRHSSTSNDGQGSLPFLDVPHVHVHGEESALRKMTTKIPFLGRTRKKSTHSVKSGGVPSTSTSGRGYESSEIVEPASSKKDRRLSHPVSSPEPASRHPPLPTRSGVPQINLPTPSFGSKFAAHFGHGHPRSRKTPSSPRSSQAGPRDGSVSDTLALPRSPRAASFDSTSSSTSGNPSTPRAAIQPTITVSPSPDSLDEYKDLFTLPRNKVTPSLVRRISSTPASEYRDKYHAGDSNVTVSASPPPSTGTAPPDPRVSSSSTSRSEIPTPIPTPRESRRPPESVFSTRTPKVLSKRRTITSTRGRGGPDDLTSADESATEDSTGRYPNPTTDLAPVIDVTPPPQLRKPCSPVPRSRMRAPSSAKENAATQPPTIPLPPPPPLSPSQSQSQPLSPLGSATSQASNTTLRRPRANTIGSIHTSTPAFPTSPSPPSPSTSIEYALAMRQNPDRESFDMDTATPEQLKQALLVRNQQYDELAVHFLEVTRAHAAEKGALEKKLSVLEAEVQRKDKEIQGFTWMLNNRGGLASSGSGTGSTAAAATASARMHRTPSTASSKPSSRMFHYADDSGAESHQTSGAESIRGSGASESSHSTRIKKLRNPMTLGESSRNLYRSSMSTKSAPASTVPDVPSLGTYEGGGGGGVNGKRSSVYSGSSSPTSSTSSLLPPSPSIPMPGSSLSAIPESASSIPSRSKRIPPSSTHTADAASGSERETTDDRQQRTSWATSSSNRVSTSTSSSSSSSIATSAYSANLKRGRPPSIAQVLEKSPVMDDVLERMRPFAGSTTAVATPFP